MNDDITGNIYMFLDLQSLFACRMVCKRWQKIYMTAYVDYRANAAALIDNPLAFKDQSVHFCAVSIYKVEYMMHRSKILGDYYNDTIITKRVNDNCYCVFTTHSPIDPSKRELRTIEIHVAGVIYIAGVGGLQCLNEYRIYCCHCQETIDIAKTSRDDMYNYVRAYIMTAKVIENKWLEEVYNKILIHAKSCMWPHYIFSRIIGLNI